MTYCKNLRLSVACLFVAGAAFAMPTREQLQKVQSEVNEVMSPDIQAVKQGKMAPEQAAAKAERFANDVTDEASKFLLLKGAFGLYMKSRKYDEAQKTLDRLTTEVKDVPDDVLVDIIRSKLKGLSKKDGGAIFALYERANARLRSRGDIAKYEKTLKQNPSDFVTRRRLALCRATLGDWKGASDDFALAGGKLAQAATAEKAGKLVDAAGLWWDASDDDAEVVREHAAALYAQLLAEGKLTGLKKALAEKRAAECPPVEKIAVKASVAKSPTLEKRTSSSAETAKASPAKIVKLPTKTFDLGKGVKVEFIQCPAGTFTMGAGPELWNSDYTVLKHREGKWSLKRDNTNPLYPHQVKITRPFWMAKYPVTVEMFEAAAAGGRKMRECEKAMGPKQIVLGRIAEWDKLCENLTWKWRRELPRGYVVRPPTSAEFEYAFKANSTDETDLHVAVWQKHIFPFPEDWADYVTPAYEIIKYLIDKGLAVEKTEAFLHRHGVPGRRSVQYGSPWLSYMDDDRIGMLYGMAGTHRPNAWGFHDLFIDTCTLDTSGEAKPYPQTCQYASFETDPFMYDESDLKTHFREFGNVYFPYDPFTRSPKDHGTSLAYMKRLSQRGSCRLVIGPDLLKEKGLAK